jgi:hypothetical protein
MILTHLNVHYIRKLSCRSELFWSYGSREDFSLFTVLRLAQDFFSHFYGDVTITDEGLQNLGLCAAPRAFAQGGAFILSHML